MPRLMSFAKTIEQIRDRTKTVTRRDGWEWLEEGTILWACEKTMGLKKGEKVQKICKIRVIDVRRERVDAILEHDRDCHRCAGEGWIVESDEPDVIRCLHCVGRGWGCPECTDGWVDVPQTNERQARCPDTACYYGITNDETTAEGFPGMPGGKFVEFFEHDLGAAPEDIITRIEFEYVDEEVA